MSCLHQAVEEIFPKSGSDCTVPCYNLLFSISKLPMTLHCASHIGLCPCDLPIFFLWTLWTHPLVPGTLTIPVPSSAAKTMLLSNWLLLSSSSLLLTCYQSHINSVKDTWGLRDCMSCPIHCHAVACIRGRQLINKWEHISIEQPYIKKATLISESLIFASVHLESIKSIPKACSTLYVLLKQPISQQLLRST